MRTNQTASPTNRLRLQKMPIARASLGLVALALAVNLSLPRQTHAATYTWDTSTSSGIQDGAGTWDTAANKFWNGSANAAWADDPGNDAVFGGGSSGTAGAINVSNNRTLNKLVFERAFSGNYNLSGSGRLQFTWGISSSTSATVSAPLYSSGVGNWYFESLYGTLTLSFSKFTRTSGGTQGRTINLTGDGDGAWTTGIINPHSDLAISLTKAGRGTWTLSGYNGYTGITTISNGVLSIDKIGNSAGTVNLSASALALDTTANSPNVFISVGSTNTAGANIQVGQFVYSITIPSGRYITSIIDSTHFSLNDGTGVSANTKQPAVFGEATALGLASTNAGNLVFDGGTLQFTGSGPANRTDKHFVINPGKTATIDISQANAFLTIDGGSTNTTGALTKTGPGTLVLAGPNSHTGTTTISNGTLLVNGSLAAGSAVSVEANATLGGTGTVNGSVTVKNGGTLTPGAASGTPRFSINSGLTLDPGAGCSFDLTPTFNSSSNDKVDVTGSLTANGNTIKINATALDGSGNDYVLITWTGSFSGTAFAETPDFGSNPPTGSGDFKVVTDTSAKKVLLRKQVAQSFSITATAGSNGSIAPAGTEVVAAGTDRTFTFLPSPGYMVDTLSVDNGVPISNPGSSYTFSSVSANHTIHITFKDLPNQTLTASVNGVGGTISDVGALSVPARSDKTYTITADTGYKISDVTVDGTSVGAVSSYTFTFVTNAHTIVASFAALGRNIPKTHELFFSAQSSDVSASDGWPGYVPSGQTFVRIGAPGIETVNGVQWEKNVRGTGTGDGYRVRGPDSAPTPCAGATIVTIVKPLRIGTHDAWNSIVDLYYDNLVLAVHNDTGAIYARRNGQTATISSTAIPDGQITVLSMVVQPNGSYKVYANGTPIINNTSTTSPFTAFTPNQNGPEPWRQYVNIGRNNPDFWSAFNGDIGDVFVYKVALSDADRQLLEADLLQHFAVPPTILTPLTNQAVASGASATFTVAAFGAGPLSYNWSVDGVLDIAGSGVDQSTYTLDNVTAAKTVSVVVANAAGSSAPSSAIAHLVPVAANTTLGAMAGQTASLSTAKLLSRAVGEPGETLSITGVQYTGGHGASVTLSPDGSTITYNPNSYTGPSDQFTYTLSDGRGGLATGTITVTVSSSNNGNGLNIVSVTPAGDTATVKFAGIPGYHYAVERSEDLQTWTEVGSNVTAPANGIATWVDSSAPDSAFYRTRFVSGAQ